MDWGACWGGGSERARGQVCYEEHTLLACSGEELVCKINKRQTDDSRRCVDFGLLSVKLRSVYHDRLL